MDEQLVLAYSPDLGDVKEAVRVRLRATVWWRLLRWTAWGGGVLAFLVAGLALLPPSPEPGTTALLLALGLLAVGCAEAQPWLTARIVFRLIRSQGDATAVVGEDGARWTSRDTETTIRWGLLPRYVETPRLFVLLTAQQSGTGFAYLPKRGLAGPADADRLRAILDRNITHA
ncbi:YcxB family protein [Streptomyces sp. SR27]|uniref:YcxB family protein n=1 Tax=unclassified Streptomyces TaxID=2593676 RepID=UPI00295A61E9|nr:YcxB family protein [Streptomyces sp. SR27]MDV9188168.1 YcxB family protein [Streptomyces sp. SR27]